MEFTLGIALLSIAIFIFLFSRLRIISNTNRAIRIAKSAVQVIRHKSLPDDDKELAVQQASLKLLRTFVTILLRSLAILFCSVIPVWLADLTGIAAKEQIVELLTRWDFLFISSAIVLMGMLIFRIR